MLLDIDLKITFLTPFSVGTGAMGETATNKPTIRDARHHPIIPGSAFKGRLRHTCEGLVRSLLNADNAVCHAPVPDTSCPLDPAWLGQYCPVCRLFGSPRRPASLYFTDLRWQDNTLAAPSLIRTGVSINRRRHAAEPLRLYDLEAVDALDIVYQGRISGHLNEAEGQALVALLLGSLRTLTTLGGGRGSGLGRCHIEAQTRVDQRLVKEAWQRDGLLRLQKGGVDLWRS
ncbi:MAG: RAMP superfamily CRISPR-associated protein [Chloroflexi bacterium]|nr:RAMP superfamily CRISPR-associated protein [Chloroflexota bacterium]